MSSLRPSLERSLVFEQRYPVSSTCIRRYEALPGVHDIRLPLTGGHVCAPALSVSNIRVSYLCLTFTGCILLDSEGCLRVVFIVATDPSIALNSCSYKRLFACLRLWTLLGFLKKETMLALMEKDSVYND